MTISHKELFVFPEYEFVEGQTMDNVQKMGTVKRNLREGAEVAYEKWIYIRLPRKPTHTGHSVNVISSHTPEILNSSW